MQAAEVRDETLFTYMADHHARLDRLFDTLLDAMRAGAPDLRDIWSELDRGLMAHMEAEERYVLPAFARVDRDEAMALLREHGKIREQLLELGVAIDLHVIRWPRSEEFVRMLRSHAAREENLLYRWADAQLDVHARDAARRHVALAR
jgi:hemerythrin superfamily protein